MKIFNTLTNTKEDFVPITPGEVKIYACGPTVYNYIHIGNARPVCVFDTLRRYLEYRGWKVTYAQNYTDVDDKIINAANEEKISTDEIAQKYIREYQVDAKGLNILEATYHPKATENVDEIIEIINLLEKKGYAYSAGNGTETETGTAEENEEPSYDVYFETKKFAEYGKLSHMPLEELESGARIATGELKRNPMDFALWKAAKPNEPYWESKWGKGRPGWHIECSAMVRKYLGNTIDIHCGGQDLIFPHHENEIAQSEAAWGEPFANYWMHNGYININNKKMSKSEGNFFTVREAANKFGYEPIRFMLLAAHYRSPINYSNESLSQAKAALERLYNFKRSIKFSLPNVSDRCEETDCKLKEFLDGCETAFIESMDDDLNTAGAMAAIFDIVKTINQHLDEKSQMAISKQTLNHAAEIFDKLNGVLGLLNDPENSGDNNLPADVLDIVEQRNLARERKDYDTADELRGKINSMGYTIEETRGGTRVYKS